MGFFIANARTYKFLNYTKIINLIAIIVVAIIGMSACWDGQLKALVATDPLAYNPIHFLVQWLVWLRAIPLFCLGLYLPCFCTILICYLKSGQENETFKQLPGVQMVLKKNTKEYKKDGKENESCSICLEDFKEGDGKPIAELNCNSNHIFHLDCLSEWVKTKDVCPMCRAPIVQVEGEVQEEYEFKAKDSK